MYNYSFSLEKFCFALISLLIPSIIFSDVLANAILIILSVACIHFIFKKKLIIPKWVKVYFALIFFYLIHPINFYDLSYQNFIKILFLLRFPLLIIIMLYLSDFLENQKFINFLLKILISFLILLSFDIFFQFHFKFDLLGFEAGMWDSEIQNYKRYGGFFGDELVSGSYLFFNLIIVLFLIKNNFIKYNNVFLILVIILMFTAIFISGERVALFKSTILLLAYIFFFSELKIRIKLFISLMIVLFGLAILTNPIIKKRYVDSTLSEIGSIENIKNNSYHFLHYKTAIKIFKDNILYGGGYKSFPILCKNYENLEKEKITTNKKAITGCSTHPHNMIIQILSSGGLIGMILFILFIYYLVIEQNKKKNHMLILFLIIYFLPIIPSGSFFTSWVNTNFWFVLGTLLILNKKNYFKIKNL
jgi:O-antigen ligase